VRPAGWAAAAVATAALLTACGGSSGSASTPSSGSSAGSSSPGGATAAASAAPTASPATSSGQAAGGSIGCLAGTWRTNSISLPQVKASGGAGGMLTVSGTGAFSVNYSGIQPMSFSDNGVKGSIQYSGQASGQLQVSGSRLSGTTQSSTFKVKSKINGVSFNLPLPKVTAGTKAPWVGYTCSGDTLTLIEPPPGGSWSMTRVS
jgi:hypothetical protein